METVHAVHGCCGNEASAHEAAADSCCASSCCGPTRHFITKEERREALEAYKDQLKKELAGIEEHLQDMK